MIYCDKISQETMQDVIDDHNSIPKQIPKNLFWVGLINMEENKATFVNYAGECCIVPLSLFAPSGINVPQFDQFKLTDYGQTVKFGDYECCTEAIYQASKKEM